MLIRVQATVNLFPYNAAAILNMPVAESRLIGATKQPSDEVAACNVVVSGVDTN